MYISKAPRIYASKAVIQVEQQLPKVLNKIENVNEENPNSEDFLKTVAELLNSDSLMLQVVRSNGLDKDPRFAPRRAESPAYLDSELASGMKRKIRVTQRRGSRLIDVEAEDQNPAMACALANSVVNEFIRQAFEKNASASKMANEFLYQQAARLKIKLEASEQKLQQYKEEHQAVSLEEKQNITVEKLKNLNEKVTEANRARMKLESDLRAVKASDGKDVSRLLQIESVAALPQVSEIQSQLVRAKSDFAAITQRYLHGHPKYIAAATQIRDLERSLAEELRKSGETLVQQYQAAKDIEDKLNRALKDQETKALELSKISIPYNVLSREAESDRILYDNVITRLKETGVDKGPEQVPYRIAENAMVSSHPVRPHKALLLLFAIFGGGALGVGIALARELIDNTVRTVDDAERTFDVRVLAAVPERKGKPGREIDFIENPCSAQADAIRALRASLSVAAGDEAHSCHIVTSAGPVEGKSYVCVNLAAAFASRGLKTLVIDADLRRPQTSELLCGAESGSPAGLADYLLNPVSLDQIIYPFAAERLFMLPSLS